MAVATLDDLIACPMQTRFGTSRLCLNRLFLGDSGFSHIECAIAGVCARYQWTSQINAAHPKYGNREPQKAVTRKRCWQFDWVVEFDTQGLSAWKRGSLSSLI